MSTAAAEQSTGRNSRGEQRQVKRTSSISLTLCDKVAKEDVKSPTDFIKAIAKPRRGDLTSISTLLGEDASWSTLNELGRDQLKKAGVTVQERK